MTKGSAFVRRVWKGWLLLVTASASVAQTGYDADRDGIADAHHERIIVVLRDGIQPDAVEQQVLSAAPELKNWKGRPPGSDFGRFLKRLSGKAGLASVRQLNPARKAKRAKPIARQGRQILNVEIDPAKTSVPDALRTLAADPAVATAEPDFLETAALNDPYFLSSGSWGQSYPDEWYLHTISAPAAWALIPPTAPGVVVAVIDSGVDRTHPDLANVVWNNLKEIPGNGVDDDGNGYVDDTYGWNFASRNNNSLDTFGHGTLVAGFIAAEQGNGYGTAGAAPGVQIMALRNGEAGTSFVSRSIEAVYYAVDQGARVINMSFGGANYSAAFAEAIRYAHDHDVVVVASAGNAGTESYTTYPSGYPGVISVGASDQTDQVASFSNYGPAVHLVAPGGRR